MWGGQEGQYITSNGELVAFDPSLRETGPSALLIKKEVFLQFLRDHNLALLWTVRGEKNAYGNGNWSESSAGQLIVTGAYMYSAQGILQGKLSVQEKNASKRNT